MDRDQILKIPSMPPISPSYPAGTNRFIDREYLIIAYKSDPDAIRRAVPEPMQPDGSDSVLYEFIKMPDSSGFGGWVESGQVIPCKLNDEPCGYTVQMFLDCEPPISGGREKWGFPKKHANPSLKLKHDTLTGKLKYAGELVALGTMAYKHEDLLGANREHLDDIAHRMAKTQVNLKIIPHVDGTQAICQLVAYNLTDINVKGAWKGPARLELLSHVNAPVADLPVREVLYGLHFVADLTLPHGRVAHDYLAKA